MTELDTLYYRELLLVLNQNLSKVWLGDYVSFHNTVHNYIKCGQYSFFFEVLTKIGQRIFEHTEITFGLTKEETEETLLQFFLIKI